MVEAVETLDMVRETSTGAAQIIMSPQSKPLSGNMSNRSEKILAWERLIERAVLRPPSIR